MNEIQEKLARISEMGDITPREKVAFLDGFTQAILLIKKGADINKLGLALIPELKKAKKSL